jgi:nucleotide-binding universal stress UspA family protein
MKEIKKILFPIDFVTEKFTNILPWVSTFAQKFNATLYVLFVTQDLSEFTSFHVPHGNIKMFQDEAVKAAQKKMASVAKEYFKDFKRVETRVAVGSPAEKILEFVEQEGINLIIMGTRGRLGLDYAIFGSVCRKVVRAASCPVVTINPDKV